MKNKYIAWRRVSTFKQNRSGLGLEAQKEIIRYFVERDGGELIADYSECYTGKDLAGCVELRKAMEHAKRESATLVIAKSDRFRNCQEALGILDEMGEGNIEFCDLPHSDRFTLTLFWALAEREALITSIRTKQALAAKKARGEKLGAASPKYCLSQSSLARRIEKQAVTKRTNALAGRDVSCLMKIMKSVFPKCDETPVEEWRQDFVNTCRDNRLRLLEKMRDARDMDDTGTLFADWDLSDLESRALQLKLAGRMQSIIRLANPKKKIGKNFRERLEYSK